MVGNPSKEVTVNEDFLACTDVIDWRDSRIVSLAEQIAGATPDDEACARLVFQWVRDNIQHSIDFDRSEVTCRASDVLVAGTGLCYAKGHLAAALLRARGIPTGFCYQRLSVEGSGPPYCLHGLNAVFLKQFGWYRFDARGNKEGVTARFTPPMECLAFSASEEGEADLPGCWPEPLPVVVDALRSAGCVEDLLNELPDIPA